MDRWCAQWQMARGAALPLRVAWQLARGWFAADRGAPDWKRPALDEVEALFRSLGLSGAFWDLR